jgi:tetratricopeptide (TPR) repeat protein
VLSRAGEREAAAFACYWLGFCLADLDHFEQASGVAEHGIALARGAESPLAEFMNLRLLGNAFAYRGLSDLAHAPSERALAMAMALGAPTYELAALHRYTKTGQHERAVSVCMRRIELIHTLGHSCAEALTLGVLSDAYYGLGRYQEAADSLLQALPVFRDHSFGRFHALCLLKLGYAYAAMGSPKAADYLKESLQKFQHLRLPRKAEEAQKALDRCQPACAG